MKFFLVATISALSLTFTSFNKDITEYDYLLDTDSSKIEWTGSSDKVSHSGSFDIESKGIEVLEGQIKGGTFIIPIASMQNYDLPKAVKPVLLKHLKSQDFFNLALHPEASFTITRTESIGELAMANGLANTLVTGDFTLLGVTNEISFPANVVFEEDELKVEASFAIDRTRWGMHYAADPELGKRHIHADVAINLKISGSRKVVTAENK